MTSDSAVRYSASLVARNSDLEKGYMSEKFHNTIENLTVLTYGRPNVVTS